MRFMLGVAESGVFPATLVLMSNWFPRRERPRQCVLDFVPALRWPGPRGYRALLGLWDALGADPGRNAALIWLPIWWFFISDHPREAKWISNEERAYLETTLAREAAELEPGKKARLGRH